MRYDLGHKNGSIDGWEIPPSPAPKPPPAPSPPLPGYCGKPLVDYGIGDHELHDEVTAGAAECCALCARTKGCASWAWHSEQNNTCHAHAVGAHKSSTKHYGCVSGFMNRTFVL